MRTHNRLLTASAGRNGATVGGIVPPVDEGGEIGGSTIRDAVRKRGEQRAGERDARQTSLIPGLANNGRIPENKGAIQHLIRRRGDPILVIQAQLRTRTHAQLQVHRADKTLSRHQKKRKLAANIGDIVG